MSRRGGWDGGWGVSVLGCGCVGGGVGSGVWWGGAGNPRQQRPSILIDVSPRIIAIWDCTKHINCCQYWYHHHPHPTPTIFIVLTVADVGILEVTFRYSKCYGTVFRAWWSVVFCCETHITYQTPVRHNTELFLDNVMRLMCFFG